MGKVKPVVKILITIAALIVYLTALVFSFLNSVPVGVNGNSTLNAAPGVFVNTIRDLGVKYPSTISPADWVFVVIWPVIFFWNLIGMLYMVASLCFSTDESPIMRHPPMMPITSLVLWSCTWGFALAWLFTYDREIMALALFFLILAAISAYGCLGFSYGSYFQDILLLEEYSNKMLWLVRILIHNGFAIAATWLTCAWKLNLATVITYANSRGIEKVPAELAGHLTSEDAGTIALSILLLEVVVWFILENFVFERYCRYTLTIYPTLIFAFSGIFVENFVVMNEGSILFPRNQVITLTGLVMACAAFVARLVLVFMRHRKRVRYA